MEEIKELYLVRHGETDFNVNRVASGQIDCCINENGIDQAIKLEQELNRMGISFCSVIHSGMLRAKLTARLLNKKIKKDIYTFSSLKEINYGRWENIEFSKIDTLRGGTCNPPEGETYDFFIQRINFTIDYIVSRFARPLVIAHHGTFKAIMAKYNVRTESIDNTCLYKITFKKCTQTNMNTISISKLLNDNLWQELPLYQWDKEIYI